MKVEELFFSAAEKGNVEKLRGLLNRNPELRTAGDSNQASALHLAAKHGSTDVVAYLCEIGFEVDARDQKQRTALAYAAEEGEYEVSKILLDKGAGVNLMDSHACILHYAAYGGNVKLAQKLIDNGADIDSVDSDGDTPLEWASEKENTVLMELLLNKGANINHKNKKGNTLLHLASNFARKKVIKFVCETKANEMDAQACNNNGYNALDIALFSIHEKELSSDESLSSKMTDYVMVIDELLNLHSKPRISKAEFFSDKAELAYVILRSAWQINKKISTEKILSASNKNTYIDMLRILRFLVGNGFDLKETIDDTGANILHALARFGSVDSLKWVLNLRNNTENSKGGSGEWLGVDAKDHDGRTPFLIAIAALELNTAVALYEAGANIEASDEEGQNFLAYLVYGNSHNDEMKDTDEDEATDADGNEDAKLLNMLEWLSKLDLSERVFECAGITFYLALMYGQVTILNYLSSKIDLRKIKYNTKISVFTDSFKEILDLGLGPLHIAAMSGNINVIQWFLNYINEEEKSKDSNNQEFGIEKRTKDGQTPFLVAASALKFEAMKAMVELGANIEVYDNDGNDAVSHVVFCLSGTSGKEAKSKKRENILCWLLNEKYTYFIGRTNLTNLCLESATEGWLHVLQLLYTKGENILESNELGYNIVHKAASFGHVEIIEWLVKQQKENTSDSLAHLNLDCEAKDGTNPLQLATANLKLSVIKTLVFAGASIKGKVGVEGNILLNAFSYLSFRHVLIENLTRSYYFPIVGDNGDLEESRVKVLEFLLQQNIEKKTLMAASKKIIFCAVKKGALSLLKKLAGLEVDVRQCDEDGYNLLHHAAALNDMNCLEWALGIRNEAEKTYEGMCSGFGIECIGGSGNTPLLHAALTRANNTTIKYLIRQGADPGRRNKKGQEIFDIFLEQYNFDMIAYCVDFLGMLGPRGWSLVATETPFFSCVDKLCDDNNYRCASQMANLITSSRMYNKLAEKMWFYAARNGDLELLKKLQNLTIHTSLINKQDEKSRNALHLVANAAAVPRLTKNETIIWLLDNGIDFDFSHDGGIELWLNAAYNCLSDVLKKMYHFGVDVNIRDKDKNSALSLVLMSPEHIADIQEKTKILDWFLDLKDMVIEEYNEDGKYLWRFVIKNALIGLLGKLLEKISCVKANSLSFLKLAYTHGNDNVIRIVTAFMVEEFLKALTENDLGAVSYIINCDNNILFYDFDGGNALHAAAFLADVSIIEGLLAPRQKGRALDVSSKDRYGRTPLLCAAEKGNIDAILLLAQLGSSLDARDNAGSTALHLAITSGHIGCIYFLLRLGTYKASLDIESAGWNGMTPFLYAVECADIEIMSFLVKLGADKDALDWSGNGAWHYLFNIDPFKDDNLVANHLSEKITDLNHQNSDKKTPLHLAVEMDKQHLVEFLLERNANIDLHDNTGKTPEDYAEKSDNQAILKCFSDYKAKLALRKLPKNQHIERRQLNIGRALGEGSFGRVYEARYDTFVVAVKELLIDRIPVRLIRRFNREARMMAETSHPSIVTFYGVTTDEPYCFVMERMKESLRDRLNNTEIEALGWPLRIKFALEIASGLNYLHTLTNPIIHGDLKSGNVLISDNDCAKLSDFGLSTIKSETKTATHTGTAGGKHKVQGTLYFLAPELLEGELASVASDIFSFAVVLSELATHEVPYSKFPVQPDSNNMMHAWLKKGMRPELPEDDELTPPAYIQLTKQCWSVIVSERPTAKQAKESLIVMGDVNLKPAGHQDKEMSITTSGVGISIQHPIELQPKLQRNDALKDERQRQTRASSFPIHDSTGNQSQKPAATLLLTNDNQSPKNQGRYTKINLSDERHNKLLRHLPVGYEVLPAEGEGDCFFDSIAQALNAQLNAGIDIKSLRRLCKQYVLEKNDWVMEAIKVDNQEEYHEYLARVEYTAEEMKEFDKNNTLKGIATWGRLQIEGRMISEKMGIQIHLIEVHEESSDASPVDTSPLYVHLLQHKAKRITIDNDDDINYDDPKTVHILCCRGHFMPVINSSLTAKFNKQLYQQDFQPNTRSIEWQEKSGEIKIDSCGSLNSVGPPSPVDNSISTLSKVQGSSDGPVNNAESRDDKKTHRGQRLE